MNLQNLPQAATRELLSSEINWDLKPAPPVQRESPIGDSTDLVVEAVIDAQAYRTLAQTAIHEVRRLTLVARRETLLRRILQSDDARRAEMQEQLTGVYAALRREGWA